MPAPPPYASNGPLDLAKNLRYTDRNGNPVDREFTADYVVTIGASLSNQIDNYNQVITTLTDQSTEISVIQSQLTIITTSGTTAILPTVSSGCLSSGTTLPLDTVTNLLVANSCAYNSALGTTTGLYLGVAAQTPNLNTAQAFGQNSTMSGISGWISTYRTVGDTLNNLWLTSLDLRLGFSRILASVTPTCAQVIVDYAVTFNSSMTFNLYFDGYTFVPSGYTDNNSLIKIIDSSGNIYQTGFNIVTQSTTTSPLVLMTSGSALSASSAYYNVQVTSRVTNSTLGTTCEKVVIKTVNSSSTGDSPYIGNFTGLTSGTTTALLVSGLSFAPRCALWEPKNSYTSGLRGDLNYSPYISYGTNSVTLNFLTPPSGLLNLDFAIFR